MTGLLLFAASLVLLLLGFRVAFVFGATALAFAWLDSDIGLEVFELLPFRIYGIMQNFTLMALPLFIFMGLVLEKSGIAARLLSSIGELFGPVRGGLAVGVVLVGAVLAASTGIVGASVVMMAVISLPVMLRHGYAQPLASGTVAASGTLGQLIPPSIVLIILGDMMQISVGELFSAAIIPGVILVLLYLVYILGITYLKPELGPAIPTDKPLGLRLKEAGRWVLPVALLIFAVLGSIFAGIASPTESAAVGALGAIGLAWVYGGLNRGMIDYTATETVKISAMIFMILIGATAFSLVFNESGATDMVVDFFAQDLGNRWLFLAASMLILFVLGFFLDFLEICFVVVPILVPVAYELDIDLLWFGILIALNLQTSFLTPPFGFSLFYLKGAVGDKVSTLAIYKGVFPFVLIQLVALGLVIAFPSLIGV